MSVFVSESALLDAFLLGKVSPTSEKRIVVNENVFDTAGIDIVDGLPVATAKGAEGQIIFKWKAQGSSFVPDTIEFTGPSTTECAESCPVLPHSATIGGVTLRADYSSEVSSPTLYLPPGALSSIPSHPTTRRMTVNERSVYLYEHSNELIVPTILLDDGTVLHNVHVTPLESTCPRLVLPASVPPSS